MFIGISVVVRCELEQLEIDLSQSDLHVNVRMRTDIGLNESDLCVHVSIFLYENVIVSIFLFNDDCPESFS